MTGNPHNDITLRFAELLRDLERSQPADTESALRELTVMAAGAVPGTIAAGITLVDRDGKVRSVASSDPVAETVDDIQDRTKEGPCLTSAWEQHTVRVNDVAAEVRWPLFCRETLQSTPVRSAQSFQLFRHRESMGALNFYGGLPGTFDDESLELGLTLAAHIAIAWNLLLRDDQFRSALASRDVIGQAKGILMERFGIDAVAAFDLLKKLSQESNTPLAALADKVVASAGDR